MDVTRTLTERHPLVTLERIAQYLRMEKTLAEMRKDWRWHSACGAGLHCVFSRKSVIVKAEANR